MTAVYLTNVIGDGGPTSAYRPDVAASYACLMIHEAKAKAVIVSPSDTLPGAIRLLTGTNLADLRAKAATTNPTSAQRTAVANWLSTNGYAPLPAAAVTWLDVIHHVAHQVNPAANLTLTGVGA